MKPPYKITSEILKLITKISEKIGEINAAFLDKPSTKLRKEHKIKTIHSSLKIEGNTLTQQQITALLNHKRVIGPIKDIKEAANAIAVYNSLADFSPTKERSFLKAHKIIMGDLIKDAGHYRTQTVGIVKGTKIAHVAPPFENVPFLMKDLFNYLKSDEIVLIKSCVFHYEMEFIHPFLDGNGRMGRLWQTLILIQKYPVFEYLPFETLISNDQNLYYKTLAECDKQGSSTKFIIYMLNVINTALNNLLDFNNRNFNTDQRLSYFKEMDLHTFSRKDYMNVFKDISSTTATRDLNKGVELGYFIKQGENNKTIYRLSDTDAS